MRLENEREKKQLMDKLVSIIMPVYNAEKYIGQAIESVLNQTYRNIELLLIDDVPTDSTMEVVSRYCDDRIRIFHNSENRGIAYSRNVGLENARGDYIAILDDDDLATPKRIEMQVEFLENNPDIDFVGGKYQAIDENGVIISRENMAYHNPLYIKAFFLFQDIYSNGEVTFRKATIDKYNIRYDENQYGMEDFKFWIQCSKVGRFYTIDEVFLYHREHQANETTRNLTQNVKERWHHKMELQKYSMRLSGIYLTDEQQEVINEFTDHGKCTTKEELRQYYHALKEVVNQAKQLKLDCVNEVEILCRKHLMYQVRHCENFWI